MWRLFLIQKKTIEKRKIPQTWEVTISFHRMSWLILRKKLKWQLSYFRLVLMACLCWFGTLKEKEKKPRQVTAALGQVLRLSKSQFPCWKMGIHEYWLTGLWRVNELITQTAERQQQRVAAQRTLAIKQRVSLPLTMEPPSCPHLTLRLRELPTRSSKGRRLSESSPKIFTPSFLQFLALSVKTMAVSLHRY